MNERVSNPALDYIMRRSEDDEIDRHLIALLRNGARQAGLMYEDELPQDITDAEYSEWFELSAIVEGVRMGPQFTRKRILDTDTGDLFA